MHGGKASRARRQGECEAEALRSPAPPVGRARAGGDGGLLHLPAQRERDWGGDAQEPRAAGHRLVHRRRRRRRHAGGPRPKLLPGGGQSRQEARRVRDGAAAGAERARVGVIRERGHLGGARRAARLSPRLHHGHRHPDDQPRRPQASERRVRRPQAALDRRAHVRLPRLPAPRPRRAPGARVPAHPLALHARPATRALLSLSLSLPARDELPYVP